MSLCLLSSGSCPIRLLALSPLKRRKPIVPVMPSQSLTCGVPQDSVFAFLYHGPVGYIGKSAGYVSCGYVKESTWTAVRFTQLAYLKDLNLGLVRSLHEDLA